MQYTRHARRRMRLYGLTEADVEAVVAAPDERDVDGRGNPRLTRDVSGRIVVVALAGDDPTLVMTAYTRRR